MTSCIVFIYLALAIALGNLYREHMEVPGRNVVCVLAAAHALKFQPLQKGYVGVVQKVLIYSFRNQLGCVILNT